MAKKIFYSILLSIVLLFTGIVVFASSDSNKTESTNLGNEITTSMDRTEDRIDNLVDINQGNDAKNGLQNVGENIKDGARNVGEDIKDGTENLGENIKNGAENVGDTVKNGVKDAENGIEDLMDGDSENRNNTAVSGRTGNYAGPETVADTNDGMSGTTWVWIILAVIAIIIIAAVWYYAAQK